MAGARETVARSRTGGENDARNHFAVRRGLLPRRMAPSRRSLMSRLHLSNMFEPNPEAEEIICSATTAIASILQMNQKVLPGHKRSLISRMIWKITEAHGKYNTQFCSEGALQDAGNFRHDHVTTRKNLIDRLMKSPFDFESILKDAIGCTVTTVEHKNLSDLADEIIGWDRYKKAGVRVFDRAEQKFRK